ncbi:MAG: Ribonuclease HII [Hyphomicrobiaceae bacterium hypho_1]
MISRISQKPTLNIELEKVLNHGGPIVGVDEAGRGALAGPVVAAAVAFHKTDVERNLTGNLSKLADSKALSESMRECLYHEIINKYKIGIGVANRHRIDTYNILNATLWAMLIAVQNLDLTPSFVLIDGNSAPKLPWRTQTVIQGDARCVSISAASVVAKVTRDRIMFDLATIFPQYKFGKHKGYGTKAHIKELREYGVCCAHRRSFRPVKLALKKI